jgi:transposase
MTAAEAIGAEVRASPVVASDETSARVAGKTPDRVGGRLRWQWVLLSSTAIYHIITDTRAAETVTTFLDDAVPEVWVADRYAGQAGHGRERQVCLAHLMRDTQYAIDSGDTAFARGFKALLLRAVLIGRRRDKLKDSTLKQYRGDLDRRLDRLLARSPTSAAGRKLRRAILRCRADLFRFVTRRDVPYTNNACERALRPSVIFRKSLPPTRSGVTGCFRSTWGANVYAAAVSVIATGRLRGLSALEAIKTALNPATAQQPC